MARALESILSELNNVYNPQRDAIRQQQEAIDPALQAEEKGLDYAKNDAFQQITNQANRRGLFYSGIPVAEEQKYTGGTFLPALANMRSKYAQQRGNLRDALNSIDLEQRKYGQGLYDQELARDEQIRQFNAQLDAQERASRAAGAGMASPSFGGTVQGAASGGYNSAYDPIKLAADQKLYNQMFIKGDGSQWDQGSLVRDYNATLKSARYGNVADQRKILFYHNFQPGIFGSSVPSFNQSSKAPAPATVNPFGKSNAAVDFTRAPLRR